MADTAISIVVETHEKSAFVNLYTLDKQLPTPFLNAIGSVEGTQGWLGPLGDVLGLTLTAVPKQDPKP